jgi:hypothetical protein
MFVITFSRTASTPCPFLALTAKTADGWHPNKLTISEVTVAISAAGKSILFITGIIVKLAANAK